MGVPKYKPGKRRISSFSMSRRKPLVLTFDAFGTLFTPREPIGQQYVRTIPSPPHIPTLDTWAGAVKSSFRQGLPSFLPSLCSLDLYRCLKKFDERGDADSEG